MQVRKSYHFILNHWPYILFFTFFTIACAALLYLASENVKQELIDQLNARQMIHAKQAAKGIENFFDDHISMLQRLAKNDHIIELDEHGKIMMREWLSSHSKNISIIARIDSQGRIFYPEPYEPAVIGQSVTNIEDFLEVKRIHQPVVSDVFVNRRGFKTIQIQIPVFKQGNFNGTLAILFPFDVIARRYVEDIRLGRDGYAWVISRNGIELSCPVPGHVGYSVFDNCKNFPDILAMARMMIRGEQGVATYTFNRIGGNVVDKVTKQAVYMPVNLANNFWSIVVASPEDEVTGTLKGFRNRLMLIGILLISGILFLFHILYRNSVLIEEVRRRQKAEEELRESEEHLRLAVDGSGVGLWDWRIPTGQTVFNDRWAQIVGYTLQDLEPVSIDTWTRLAHPDDLIYLDGLLQKHFAGETPSLECEIRMRHKEGHWVWIHDRGKVTEWDQDGKPVRMSGTHLDITERKQAESIILTERDLGLALARTTSLSSALRLCLDAALKATGFESGGIYMLDPVSGDFGLMCHEGVSEVFAEQAHLIAHDSDKARHIQQGKSFYIEGTGLSGAIGEREIDNERIKSYAVVPIESKDMIIGSLNVASHVFDRISGYQRHALETIANQIGRAMARLQAEEALRQSEATLRSVFATAPVGLSVMIDRVYQSVNKSWCEMFGYEENEIIGHSPRMLHEDENEYERVGRQLYKDLQQRGLAAVQTRLCRKDGVVRDVFIFAAPLPSDDDRLHTVTAVEDITDRTRVMAALEANQRRLGDIIDFLPDATLVIDREGRVIAWNRAIEAMTGVEKKDMIGKGNYEYALPFYGYRRPILIDLALHPEQAMTGRYTAIRKVGDTLFGEAFTPLLPPGDVHLSGTASVLRDDRGEIVAVIECIRDNSERKRLEARLNRAEKMEALGTLAGGVAHDLNNVLGVMVGYSELFMARLPEGSPLKKYADNILQSSVRGAAIIQDLLTLARRGVTVSEVVNLNDLIAGYLRSPEFEKLRLYHPEVNIRTDLENGLLNIKGSPVHLGKTIMNLVSNAVEAIAGRGEVAIDTENRYMDRPVQGYDDIREGDYAVLSISDTGSGISPNDLGKIFEPFYTKKVMGRSGTGLGLAVVWGTVKDHQGYVDVQSEEGRGSTFTLYFPVTREKPVTIEKAISPVDYMSKGESILVVDDVKEQRELAANMLEMLGYHVEAVAGGEEAVEYVRKNGKVDLLVLDMIMDPGIDGMETYRRILEIHPDQRAVIVSGFSETDRVLKAQQMGAGAFVRKPYILEKIGIAVKNELNRP